MDSNLSDARILESWHTNAEPWTSAVRAGAIESRRLVTDAAVRGAILKRAPQSLLDLGCGEGWLVRAMAEHGIHTLGVDAVPALVDQAIKGGGGEFRVASYDDVVRGTLGDVKVDVVVANFAFIGKEAVDAVVASVPSLLTPMGALIIQTLHPLVATGDLPYADGWRRGSWAGFGDAFSDPAPWYFRTLETWVTLITGAGFRVLELLEPVHPATGKPASLILIAEVQR